MALTLAQTVFQLWLGRYFLPVQQKHLLAFSSEQTQPEYTRKECLYFTANCWHNTLSSLADLIPKNSLLPKSDPNKVPGTQFLVPGTQIRGIFGARHQVVDVRGRGRITFSNRELGRGNAGHR